MVTASSANLFIFFLQVLSRHFIKRNFPKWSFHLVKYGNLKMRTYILSRYAPVGAKPSKVVPFEVGWSDVW